jgi:hypothetical protein
MGVLFDFNRRAIELMVKLNFMQAKHTGEHIVTANFVKPKLQ